MIKTAGASGVVQVLPQIHRFVNFQSRTLLASYAAGLN